VKLTGGQALFKAATGLQQSELTKRRELGQRLRDLEESRKSRADTLASNYLNATTFAEKRAIEREVNKLNWKQAKEGLPLINLADMLERRSKGMPETNKKMYEFKKTYK
jgi:hypothetical protein